MEFWESCEAERASFDAIVSIGKLVEPYLKKAFAQPPMLQLDIKFRYIPITMPPNLREKYTARSIARIKQRIYDCAPQLDYDTFVRGTFEEQLAEYINGIKPSAVHLKKFGASPEQVAAFVAIVDEATSVLLRPNIP